MACKYKSRVWDNGWCNVACMYCTLTQECTCEHNRRTYADLIRDEVFAKISTDEAMADFILALDISLSDEGKGFTNVYCHGDNGCVDENEDITCNDEMRKACILRWLQQSDEEVTDNGN